MQPRDAELARIVSNEAEYFARNTERMRYPAFRAQGLFAGSGVIEAGCKIVIASRLKRSGMFWTVRGANAIIALRSLVRPMRPSQPANPLPEAALERLPHACDLFPNYTCEYASGRSTMLVTFETVGGSSLNCGSAESFFQSGSAKNLSQAASSVARSGKLSM
jgi:hypothetical protein